MDWQSGDFTNDTTFIAPVDEVRDVCKGGQVQCAVRDQHGNWEFGNLISL